MLSQVLDFLHVVKVELQQHDVSALGPAPAPLARKAGFHRFQLLVKSSSRKKMKGTLMHMRDWLALNTKLNGIRWNIDVDPIDLS